MEKARGAEELLGACLAALSDDAGSVGARERLGLLPDNGHDDRKRDAQAVHAALLQVGAGAGSRVSGAAETTLSQGAWRMRAWGQSAAGDNVKAGWAHPAQPAFEQQRRWFIWGLELLFMTGSKQEVQRFTCTGFIRCPWGALHCQIWAMPGCRRPSTI